MDTCRAALAVAVMTVLVARDGASQSAERAPRLRADIELGFLSLDDGPFGAPRADNLGVGLRGSLLPRVLAGRVAVEVQASYLVALRNWVPQVASIDAMLVAAVSPLGSNGRTPNPFVSVGFGGANFIGRATTLEAYCNADASQCVGRQRFAEGWREWVTVGAGLEVQIAGWLPRRVHGQLVIPARRFAEEGQPPYWRVGLSWRVSG